jgi:predicted HAD superfamily hydrolase
MKIAFVIHVYYRDVFDEICSYLNNMPVPYSAFISVKDQNDKEIIERKLQNLTLLNSYEIRIVENRGRDIAPMLVDFAQSLISFDYICHIHTKKTLRAGSERIQWRSYLFEMLLGSEERIKAILSLFQKDYSVGIIYPEAFVDAPYWGATWLGNKGLAKRMHERMNIRFDPDEYLEFPAGSMFWARTLSLAPLFQLGLTYDDFPIEDGQHDGTLQHTIERIFTIIVHSQGYRHVLIQDRKQNAFSYRSERNIREYLKLPFSEKVERMLPFGQVVSIDIFDTLLIRPFANPDMVFQYLEEFVERDFHIHHFMEKRKNAEHTCRVKKNVCQDVKISEIYSTMAEEYDISPDVVLQLLELEITTEKKLLIPREQVINTAYEIKKTGRRIILISDTYFEKGHIEEILRENSIDFFDALYISSEIGKRKDRGDLWDHILIAENVEKEELLHIGDNEQSDIHTLSSRHFLSPVHVMRPSLLFRHSILGEQLFEIIQPHTSWRNNLLFGVFSNYFCRDPYPATLFDSETPLNDPSAFGYVIIGPIVFNFINWLIKQSTNDTIDHLLFNARDGYLLDQAYRIFKDNLHNSYKNMHIPQSTYFLISRRAAVFATIEKEEDISHLFDSKYRGTIRDFFEKRWNFINMNMFQEKIGSDALDQFILLPRDTAVSMKVVKPVTDIILDEASIEREAFIHYYNELNLSNSKNIGIVDIGYSGTTQKSLINIFKRPFAGYYFVTSKKAKELSNTYICKSYFGDYIGSINRPPIFRFSMLMEAILVSPNGQLIRFTKTPTGSVPIYKDQDTQYIDNYPIIHQIHTGALKFVSDMNTQFGSSVLDIEFPKDTLQMMYQMVVKQNVTIGDLKNHFIVDDDFCGYGNISIFDFYNPPSSQ